MRFSCAAPIPRPDDGARVVRWPSRTAGICLVASPCVGCLPALKQPGRGPQNPELLRGALLRVRAAPNSQGRGPKHPDSTLWWPSGPADANSQGGNPRTLRGQSPPFSWGRARASLPLFCFRPPLPCPCAAAMMCWHCMTLQDLVLCALCALLALPTGGRR